jgi:hypothetical protein
MDGPGNEGEKRDHINQVGKNAPHSYFPGPGFSIKEGEIPEKVFIRVHGMYSPKDQHRSGAWYDSSQRSPECYDSQGCCCP